MRRTSISEAGEIFDRPSRGLGHVRFEGQTVISEHADARKLIAYWRSKRTGEHLPPRAAIQPREIARLLPHIFLAEPKNADWRYRLVGTGIAGRLKADFTGKSLRQVFEPATAKRVNKLYSSVAESRQPLSRKGRFLGLEIEHAVVENVHLPILAPDGQTPWILGGVFFFVQVPWHWGPPAV